MGVNPNAAAELDWHDVTAWGVMVDILPEEKRLRWFDRLPSSAQVK